jgi:hypothetical protein
MTRRRLRLPALIALLAVTAPVLASGSDSIAGSARQFGASVRRSSSDFGRRVAHDSRQAGHQFHAGLHQVGHSFHRWWDGMRSTAARA